MRKDNVFDFQSVIRRGNHFILLEDKWVLIDGPWFHALSGLCASSSNQVLLSFCTPSYLYMRRDRYSSYFDMQQILWQAIKWVPTRIFPVRSLTVYEEDIPVRKGKRYYPIFEQCSIWTRSLRAHIGWHIASGRLPCYLHKETPASSPDEEDVLLALEDSINPRIRSNLRSSKQSTRDK